MKAATYYLIQNANLFEVRNERGRPLFFYKIKQTYTQGRCSFDILSNICFQYLDDSLVNYCIHRLYAEPAAFEKLEYYLHLITKRVLESSKGKSMVLDPYFINSEGQINYTALKVHHQIIADMIDHFGDYFQFEKAYTKDTSILMYQFLNDPVIQAHFLASSTEVNATHFEYMIPNKEIGIAYINNNTSSARYFEMNDKDRPEDKEWGYILLIEEEIVLFFGIKERS